MLTGYITVPGSIINSDLMVRRRGIHTLYEINPPGMISNAHDSTGQEIRTLYENTERVRSVTDLTDYITPSGPIRNRPPTISRRIHTLYVNTTQVSISN